MRAHRRIAQPRLAVTDGDRTLGGGNAEAPARERRIDAVSYPDCLDGQALIDRTDDVVERRRVEPQQARLFEGETAAPGKRAHECDRTHPRSLGGDIEGQAARQRSIAGKQFGGIGADEAHARTCAKPIGAAQKRQLGAHPPPGNAAVDILQRQLRLTEMDRAAHITRGKLGRERDTRRFDGDLAAKGRQWLLERLGRPKRRCITGTARDRAFALRRHPDRRADRGRQIERAHLELAVDRDRLLLQAERKAPAHACAGNRSRHVGELQHSFAQSEPHGERRRQLLGRTARRRRSRHAEVCVGELEIEFGGRACTVANADGAVACYIGCAGRELGFNSQIAVERSFRRNRKPRRPLVGREETIEPGEFDQRCAVVAIQPGAEIQFGGCERREDAARDGITYRARLGLQAQCAGTAIDLDFRGGVARRGRVDTKRGAQRERRQTRRRAAQLFARRRSDFLHQRYHAVQRPRVDVERERAA